QSFAGEIQERATAIRHGPHPPGRHRRGRHDRQPALRWHPCRLHGGGGRNPYRQDREEGAREPAVPPSVRSDASKLTETMMSETSPFVVSADWLQERVGRPGLSIVDASWYL